MFLCIIKIHPISLFNPVTFLCLSQARVWIPNVICHGLLCVHWVKVRSDCSLCWYWWNYLPLLFTLSFHNQHKAIMEKGFFLHFLQWHCRRFIEHTHSSNMGSPPSIDIIMRCFMWILYITFYSLTGEVGIIKLIYPRHFFIEVPVPCQGSEWVVMSARIIDFASFYHFSIELWNCFDCAIFCFTFYWYRQCS